MSYPMPDILSINDMKEYGYTYTKMLPLTKNRAIELWNDGCEIYELHYDDFESLVTSEEDIVNYKSDMFGIEKNEWLRYLIRIAQDNRTKVYYSAVAENEQYVDSLLGMEKSEIIECSYKTAFNNDVLLILENNMLSDKTIDYLAKLDNPLSLIYDEWLETKTDYMQTLQDIIEDRVCIDELEV